MVRTIAKFIQWESAGGIILMITAALALIISNSSFNQYYNDFLSLKFSISLGDFALSKPVILWINDGFMAIFFLLVGLEIKREFIQGELSSISQASLPAAAAIGGMLVPALIYVYVNYGDAYALKGWAIPAATDIAFALGVLSILGSRVPSSLRVFLTAIAILDDIGAIIIIALFYTAELSLVSLVLAFCCIVILFALNRAKVCKFTPYAIVGAIMWVCVLKSGIHATLAGVVLAMAYPINDPKNPERSPLREMEHAIHPWVAFAILPLFAFANAGVSFKGLTFATLLEPIPLGIALGLFLGKQCGIFASTWLFIKCKLAKLPQGATWGSIYGVSLLCGIGFTMSLFIGTLAFQDGSGMYHAWLRLGVLLGSITSAIVGFLVLWAACPKTNPDYHLKATKEHHSL